MYATDYFERQMINLMRGTSITAPAAVYLALFYSDPTDTGTGGTEVSYTGYTRQRVVFSAPATSGNGLMIQNSEQISFAEAPTATNAVTHIGLYDALSGGNMLLYGRLDVSLNIQPGVTPVFRANSIRWIWSGNLTTLYRTNIMNTLRGASCSGFNPYIALCNGDPTGSGQEFSGGGYSRIEVTMSAGENQSGSGAMQTSNTADVLSDTATSNWGQLTHVAIADAATGGNLFAVIALTETFQMNNGSAAGFRAGNLRVNIN